MITAKIIKDSINGSGDRITTWILKYPRFIHSEFMTHRVFSRNAASSRAIPAKKLIDAVINEPAMPVWWGKNEPGMQAKEEVTGDTLEICKTAWLDGRDQAVEIAKELLNQGLHKQVVNRVLEPWCHMTIVATSTEYGNFFSLRAHPDAQPEFQALAYLMLDEYKKSIPVRLPEGHWHIPFSDKMPDVDVMTKIKIATARCARVSYLTFEGEIDVDKDLELHDRLSKSGHWSPFEHCAYASPGTLLGGNFKGWVQYRKTFANENAEDPRLIV